MISIIIPVYNVAPYLVESLNSVIQQTYQNLEIIIIDDGSTDGSETICDNYSSIDCRIQVIHQDNQGLSAARNRGLDSSTGDLISFLDSDDVFYPEMLQTMVEEMNRCGADIVVCDYDWEKHQIEQREGEYNTVQIMQELINGRIETAVWNKVYKAELWDGIRFPEGHVFEGTRTTYRLLERAKTVRVINKRLMRHRTRSGSIIQTKSLENIVDSLIALHEFEEFVGTHIQEFFFEEDYKKLKERNIRNKMTQWTVLNTMDPIIAESLRKSIIDSVDDNMVLDMKTSVAYKILEYCPDVLRICLPIYSKWNTIKRRLKSG